MLDLTSKILSEEDKSHAATSVSGIPMNAKQKRD